MCVRLNCRHSTQMMTVAAPLQHMCREINTDLAECRRQWRLWRRYKNAWQCTRKLAVLPRLAEIHPRHGDWIVAFRRVCSLLYPHLSDVCDVYIMLGNIFGRPLVKRFTLCLSDRCLSVCPSVCLSCPVCSRLHCARLGHSSPPQKRGRSPSPNLPPISIVAKQLDASRCHSVWR